MAATKTQTQTEDHPAEPITAVITEADKSTDSSTDRKNSDSSDKKLNIEDPVSTIDDKSNINDNVDGDSVTDTQRKIRRAERFGMPVKLSEEEKRNSRAERFGTAPSSQGSNTTKKAEELKRKARAERFGITKSTPAEEDEKKKARLSRFGSASSTGVNPLEEEKKKARALRFAGKAGGEA
ncbi:uncharacterized protein [Rutidosis leptorrhynchoides]|uniref:uncharacterized protein n=1 Tax=Rutidosis leptorrhynchoides TaxID=125765 RepID=UPI003A98F80B